MTPRFFIDFALAPTLSLLPAKMDTQAGRAMIVAICLQESHLTNRRQLNGPARGYAQFEAGDVRGVLAHPASGPIIQAVLASLDYDPNADVASCYSAIGDNDILAVAFARLLLYTLPQRLPSRYQVDAAWEQYLSAWRPGRPHRESWDAFYASAWTEVTSGTTPA